MSLTPYGRCPECKSPQIWDTHQTNDVGKQVWACRHGHTFGQEAQPTEIEQRLEDATAELNQIRIALEQVAVYEGIVDVSPTALLVSELVRDHEELEKRIDSVLSLIALQDAYDNPEMSRAAREPDYMDHPMSMDAKNIRAEIARLLKGGERIPDTIEGLDGD